tara:strand:- start:7847 stop:8149 length:303 start_codon:yes stop_codon:yes gene_type:complete
MAFLETPTADDVVALIRHQYAESEFDAIMKLLGPISTSGELVGWHAARIQLAALAMSGGNRSLIAQYIDLGNKDARDLQMAVESQLGPSWERACLWEIKR